MSNSPTDEIKLSPGSAGMIYPFLRIYEEEGPFLKSFKISGRLVVVGRDETADLRIQDKYISRKHFQVEFLGEGKLFLQDLGSANGTFLNGKKVGRSKLEDGDEIVIGEKRIVISYKHKSSRTGPAKARELDSKTIPDYSSPFESPTEVASEESIQALKKQIPERSEVSQERSYKYKKVESVPEVVDLKKIRKQKRVQAAREISKSMEKIIDIAGRRDRRAEIRPRDIFAQPGKKLELKRIALFFMAGILMIFVFIFRYAREYFGTTKIHPSQEVASSESDLAKGKVEPLTIPRPDVKKPIKIAMKTPPEDIPNESEIRSNLKRSLDRIKTSKRKESEPVSDTRVSKPQSAQTEEKPSVSRKSAPKTLPVRPTAAQEIIKSLRDKEVLTVDFDKESSKLVASREATKGKESKTKREIDIREVQKMLDIDVGLSIMSEEVMLSEKRDVNKFRNNLKRKISNVSYCYQDALTSDPNVDGNIRVNFTIGSNGQVHRARIENSSVGNRALNDCVLRRVKGTRFDEPPHDNFMISYTFKFQRGTVDFTR